MSTVFYMVNSSYLVDSSVFISFYAEGDSCHADAVAILSEIESSELLVHPYVIQEVVSVLTYKLGVTAAKKFIADIQQANNISILPVDAQRDMKSFSARNKKISLVDSALIDISQMWQVPLITFDKELRTLAK
jgi:predicted nucleic acid-binding protein